MISIDKQTSEAHLKAAPIEEATPRSLVLRAAGFLLEHHAIVVLAYLIALELVIFAGSYAKAGFFLDDWLTLFEFKFGPSDFWESMRKYLADDPRVLIRPIEAPYFATLYKLFGFKPAPYHFINGAMEVLTSFFLYLSILRLTNSKAAAFVSSALCIVNPTHDATHYWMVCSSATLSLALFMSSFYCILEATCRNQRGLYTLSAVMLTLSLFNYESCLALPLVSVLGVGWIVAKRAGPKRALLKCLNISMFLSIPLVATFVYQRYLSPLIASSWVKRIELDPAYMFQTIARGLEIQTPWYLADFIRAHLLADFFTGLNTLTIVLLTVCLLSGIFIAAYFMHAEAGEKRAGNLWLLVGYGGLFSVLSLCVFGLNPEYMPLMITLINRVNLGASVGASIATGALIIVLLRALGNGGKCVIGPLTASLVFGAILAIFGLSDRAFSHAWIASTVVQGRIREVMASNAPNVKPGEGVIVVNCPRYVLWAPVADGTWDLQAMLRIAASTDKIFATSLSDRLQVTREGVRDYVLGIEIANIKFKDMFLMEPHTATFRRVQDVHDFVESAQKTTRQMGIDQSVIDRWRGQVDCK